jgi:hypothetical protein
VMVLAVPALAAGAAGLRIEFDETAAVGAIADGGEAPSTGVDSFREFVAASKGLFTAGFLAVFVLVLFKGKPRRIPRPSENRRFSAFANLRFASTPWAGLKPTPGDPNHVLLSTSIYY